MEVARRGAVEVELLDDSPYRGWAVARLLLPNGMAISVGGLRWRDGKGKAPEKASQHL